MVEEGFSFAEAVKKRGNMEERSVGLDVSDLLPNASLEVMKNWPCRDMENHS